MYLGNVHRAPMDNLVIERVQSLYSAHFGPVPDTNYMILFAETNDSRPEAIYPEISGFPNTIVRLTTNLVPDGTHRYPQNLTYQFGHELFHVYQRELWHGGGIGASWQILEPIHYFAHAAALSLCV